MDKSQARGYYFEEIVKRLMKKTNYINVTSEDIPGRGANHQIDSVGFLSFTIPFAYPIRLIAEAKWHKDKIGLGGMRSFVSVMKDISENYFVPINIRGHHKRPELPKRYTDTGAFFSVPGFTLDAQDFAWAHGIYLISFDMNTILNPIIKRAEDLINRDVGRRVSKDEVIRKAQDHFENDRNLAGKLNTIYSYMGILDGIYPVMLTSDREFDFKENMPDEFEVGRSDRPNATKEYRREERENVNFRFNFRGSNFEFTLPWNTSKYLIKEIERTYKKTRPFAFIDIPIVLEQNERMFRRLFRLNLSLPDSRRVVDILKD